MSEFCLSSNYVKSFSLRHISDIGAASEDKPIFFNTFHSSLDFLVLFWSWFLTKFAFLFFIFWCTELRCSLKRSWSTWSFVLKNVIFNLSLTIKLSHIKSKIGKSIPNRMSKNSKDRWKRMLHEGGVVLIFCKKVL